MAVGRTESLLQDYFSISAVEQSFGDLSSKLLRRYPAPSVAPNRNIWLFFLQAPAKESICIRQFLSELEYTAINSSVIHCDNQAGAIASANKPEYHSPSIFLGILCSHCALHLQ